MKQERKFEDGSDCTETELHAGEDRLRLVIEASPTGMILVDPEGRIVQVNGRAAELFGYSREDLRGTGVEMLIPERFRQGHPEFRALFAGESASRPMGSGRDLYGLRRDGSEVPIEIGLNPLRTREGEFILSSVVDITERKRSDDERARLLMELRALNTDLEDRVQSRTAELTATLKEREVLLQEIHHRVKNNLQVISSIINMQARMLECEVGRRALEQCQIRIQAIALIHEKLYQSKDYSQVPFSEYASSLATNVFLAMGVSTTAIKLEVDIQDVWLPVHRAIPCGLILNELMTNAIKHAFPNGRLGTVRVELHKRAARRIELVVRDDGVGLSPLAEDKPPESVGMQLVATLAEQLDAQLEVTREGGTCFRLVFKTDEL